tara:strand:+ start:30745 stop:31716 length:972 start_codon:yes stop_codon:yes gene_type:complete
MPMYTPMISGSGIIFISGSDSGSALDQINIYTSSNPDLVALGTHTGSWTGTSDLHLNLWDTSVSGSHSAIGIWTGSLLTYTESGANSHGIPVGSPSVFTASVQANVPNSTGSYPQQTPLIMSMSDAGDFSIAMKAAAGAPKDSSVFFVKNDGAIGIGTENPSSTMELDGNAKTATTATNALNSLISARATNASHYLTFVTSTSGNTPLYVDNGISYNPSTNKLTAGYFVGNGSLLTNLPGGGSSECATTVKVTAMEAVSFPIVTSADETPDGGCESLVACDAVKVDCSKKGIWINGGLITHDKGTFTFEYNGGTTTIKVIAKR